MFEIPEIPAMVYNFEVAGFHTYYVGNSSVLVHNKCVAQGNGVRIESYYPKDHNPPHLHINGGGSSARIGLVNNEVVPIFNTGLTQKQASVVKDNLAIILDFFEEFD